MELIMTSVTITQSLTTIVNTPTAYAPEPKEEYFTSSGGYRQLVSNDSEEGIRLINNIKDIYGDVLKEYPSYYLGHYDLDNTITVFTPSLNTKEAARKELTLFKETEHSYLLPEGSFVFVTGIYKPLDSYSFPEKLYNYLDIYFKCDHATVCQYFNYDFPQGTFRTYYGASLNLITNELSKVKAYTYNEESREAYWDEFYLNGMAKLK
jgi:hypothetical protein